MAYLRKKELNEKTLDYIDEHCTSIAGVLAIRKALMERIGEDEVIGAISSDEIASTAIDTFQEYIENLNKYTKITTDDVEDFRNMVAFTAQLIKETD